MPAAVTGPRLYLAAVCILDGLRGLQFNPDLGSSVLTRLPFALSGFVLAICGVILIISGALTALGLLTRLAVIPALIISAIIIVDAARHMDTLGLDTGLNYLVRALGSGTVGLLLLFRGAGIWSMDASLSLPKPDTNQP